MVPVHTRSEGSLLVAGTLARMWTVSEHSIECLDKIFNALLIFAFDCTIIVSYQNSLGVFIVYLLVQENKGSRSSHTLDDHNIYTFVVYV